VEKLLRNSCFILLNIIAFVLFSCGNKENKKEVSDSVVVGIDSLAVYFKYQDVYFCTPSPHYVSLQLKSLGLKYNSDYLSNAYESNNFNSIFKKALNLGVLGADIGYQSVFNRNDLLVKQFDALKSLTTELKLDKGLNPELLKKIEDNLFEGDTLSRYFSLLIADSRGYLEDNLKHDISALIAAGGFIESVYILCESHQESPNPYLLQFIAQQKQSIENLIKLLSPFYNRGTEITWLIDSLSEVAYEYDFVDVNYSYKEQAASVNDEIIDVNIETQLSKNDEAIQSIINKMIQLRMEIIS